jgi:serine/threonine-protein kinase ULK/ATG1
MDEKTIYIGPYVVKDEIGRGSFAIVYKGIHETSQQIVAIKSVHLDKLNRKLLENLEKEISTLKLIDHPNIIKLYDVIKTESHMNLIMEYCELGDLSKYLKAQRLFQKIDAAMIKQLFIQVADAFMYMHQHNLMHRDLKPQNILVTGKSQLKIADFGFVRHIQTLELAETLCGSPVRF